MSDPGVNDHEGADDDSSARRGFLSKSGMMLAFLALAQGNEVASAEPRTINPIMGRPLGPAAVSQTEVRSASEFLKSAMQMGSINTASAQFKSLSPEVQKSLATLSPADLRILAQAQTILQSHLRVPAADNNGTVGM